VYQEESAVLRKNVRWVKLLVHRHNQTYPQLNSCGDNGINFEDIDLLQIYWLTDKSNEE